MVTMMLQGQRIFHLKATLAREHMALQPRQTLDGESTPTQLHEAKQALLQQFVQTSRRWSIADPQVSVARSRREAWSAFNGDQPKSPMAMTWAPGQHDNDTVTEQSLSLAGLDGGWKSPEVPCTAAALLQHPNQHGEKSSDPRQDGASAAFSSSTPQPMFVQTCTETSPGTLPDSLLQTSTSSQNRGEQQLEASRTLAACSMDQSLRSLRISSAPSPRSNEASGTSPLRQRQHGAPESPVKALFIDDVQLQACGEQSDEAVMEQLMHWTAQILQRMLKAAERATLEARGDLEAAVKELAEERKQGAHAEAEADTAQEAAQQADQDRAAVQAQLDEEQSRIAAMRAEVGARRARLDELQTTYAAKREMVSEAQMQWSKRSASCATQVALGSNGASGMRTTCSQPGEEAPSLGVSLRRAMGELGSLFGSKSKSPEGRSMYQVTTCTAPAGALPVHMMPFCSTRSSEYRQGEEEGDGKVLVAYTNDSGTPMMKHGMECPPQEAISPGEMILERML